MYGLHVFAIADRCSSLHETLQTKAFSHTSQTPGLRPEKEVPEASKGHPKTLLWNLQKPLENAPKTDHRKNSLFAPATNRGICCLRALDPGNGTPIIYRYIYIYRRLGGSPQPGNCFALLACMHARTHARTQLCTVDLDLSNYPVTCRNLFSLYVFFRISCIGSVWELFFLRMSRGFDVFW